MNMDGYDDGMDSKDIDRAIRRLGGEGILTPKDIKELNRGCRRVFMLMSDGLWHDANQIRYAAGRNGMPASEGIRRMRELRDIPGVDIERRRTNEDSRLFEYRLKVYNDGRVQKELFDA